MRSQGVFQRKPLRDFAVVFAVGVRSSRGAVRARAVSTRETRAEKYDRIWGVRPQYDRSTTATFFCSYGKAKPFFAKYDRNDRIFLLSPPIFENVTNVLPFFVGIGRTFMADLEIY
jgi:hypothetical protein